MLIPTWWKTNWSDFGFSIDINGELVSTEKKELKHDWVRRRHSTITPHETREFIFCVLKISKSYMKLFKYTKLNKLLATYSVKSKELLHYRRNKRSPSGDGLPWPEVSTRDHAGRACLPGPELVLLMLSLVSCPQLPLWWVSCQVYGWHLWSPEYILTLSNPRAPCEEACYLLSDRDERRFQGLVPAVSGPWKSSCSTALWQSQGQLASAAQNSWFKDKVQLSFISCVSHFITNSWFALKQCCCFASVKIYCLFVFAIQIYMQWHTPVQLSPSFPSIMKCNSA